MVNSGCATLITREQLGTEFEEDMLWATLHYLVASEPQEINPRGLYEIKQAELYMKWRPYVLNPFKDIICLRPQEEVLQKFIYKKREKGLRTKLHADCRPQNVPRILHGSKVLLDKFTRLGSTVCTPIFQKRPTIDLFVPLITVSDRPLPEWTMSTKASMTSRHQERNASLLDSTTSYFHSLL